MINLYYRAYQIVFKMVSRFLPWREPAVLEGADSLLKLPELIKIEKMRRVLIITSNTFIKNGTVALLMDNLKALEIESFLYSDTVPNPTIDNVEDALKIYNDNHAQGLIALGGGSIIDCAKGVAARVARPNKSISQMKGVLKVNRKTPYLYAVPTTAGTGSEATLAAVISNPKTHEKYAINDPVLIPNCAVLDPKLTFSLPPFITATTGMDALTHAVEAYIGKSNTALTKKMSIEAVKLIFKYLPIAYEEGNSYEAREKMLRASYCAGVAFTRAYVGNVHAIAHTLSGFYNTPHGLANAVILPHVLEYYGSNIDNQLSELADAAGICDKAMTIHEKSLYFVESIRKMNAHMGIPTILSDLKESDIPTMIERAFHESNPLYPVPVIFTRDDFKNLYRKIKE